MTVKLSRPAQGAHSTDVVTNLEHDIARHMKYSLGRDGRELSEGERLTAVSLAVRDRLVDLLFETEERYRRAGAKRLYYLSMEFLMGRALGNNLVNLGLSDVCREAVQRRGGDLEVIEETEPDAALGNGG